MSKSAIGALLVFETLHDEYSLGLQGRSAFLHGLLYIEGVEQLKGSAKSQRDAAWDTAEWVSVNYGWMADLKPEKMR